MQINYLAVIAAAVSAFVLGSVWYSVLFGKIWRREVGISDADMKSANMVMIFGSAFALSLIASFVFAMFLGPHPSLMLALGAGRVLRPVRVGWQPVSASIICLRGAA